MGGGRCASGGGRCAVVGCGVGRWWVGYGIWAVVGEWAVVGACGGCEAYGRAVMFNFIYLVRRSAWFLKIQKSVFSPF